MFAFLASVHRVAPQLEESTEEQENSEQMREGPLTVKYVKRWGQRAQGKKLKIGKKTKVLKCKNGNI